MLSPLKTAMSSVCMALICEVLSDRTVLVLSSETCWVVKATICAAERPPMEVVLKVSNISESKLAICDVVRPCNWALFKPAMLAKLNKLTFSVVSKAICAGFNELTNPVLKADT